jgi:hypothetical protein
VRLLRRRSFGARFAGERECCAAAGLTILATLLCLLATASASAESRASLCIAGVREPNAQGKGLANPSGGNPEPDYSVQVNGGQQIRVPRLERGEKPIGIASLDQQARHSLIVRRAGKRVESFHFRFPADTLNQCLVLNELYLTWQIWPAGSRLGCKCT